ncbi:winged helix-turn-helix transcriptional regulator [Dyella silvatica]|uniref:winged helix-turn-helix transcriptional regulator n=1 Tax=Dyella silvatica TaxID=2992128 RepID=UPI002250BA7B|nr:helix-turn-helix domain-containing protein [Dyella silvatica]
MVKRISHKASCCPIARPLDVIGDGWSLLIVRDIFDGLHRFGELQKNLGVAKNILAARLRNLVEHGILETAPVADGSEYQEYLLTAKGRGLFPLLVALRQWGEDYFFDDNEIGVHLVDRKRGQPIKRLELRAQDGRLLAAEDTLVSHAPPKATAASQPAKK